LERWVCTGYSARQERHQRRLTPHLLVQQLHGSHHAGVSGRGARGVLVVPIVVSVSGPVPGGMGRKAPAGARGARERACVAAQAHGKHCPCQAHSPSPRRPVGSLQGGGPGCGSRPGGLSLRSHGCSVGGHGLRDGRVAAVGRGDVRGQLPVHSGGARVKVMHTVSYSALPCQGYHTRSQPRSPSHLVSHRQQLQAHRQGSTVNEGSERIRLQMSLVVHQHGLDPSRQAALSQGILVGPHPHTATSHKPQAQE
jgi:hypothetical protein